MNAPHPLDLLRESSAVAELAFSLRDGRTVQRRGIVGSSSSLVAGALARVSERPILFVCAHLDDADEALDELTHAGIRCARLPALEMIPGETHVSLGLFAERLGVLRKLAVPATVPEVTIAPIPALMQAIPSEDELSSLTITVRKGETIDPAAVVDWLDRSGYRRGDSIEEPGDYAVRGGIIDLFPTGCTITLPGGGSSSGTSPLRLDFFGDQLDHVSEIDLDTMGSDASLVAADIVTANTELISHVGAGGKAQARCAADLLPKDTIVVLNDTMELTEQARGYFERVVDSKSIFGPPELQKRLRARFASMLELSIGQLSSTTAREDDHLPVRALPELPRDAGEAVAEIARWTTDGTRVIVACQNEGEAQRLGELLREFGGPNAERVESIIAYIHRGFLWDDGGLAVVPHHELLHRFLTRRKALRSGAGRTIDAFLDFEVGDVVVHADHGLARFVGLERMKGKGRGQHEQEYLLLEFSGRSKLRIPATQIDLVQRYVGGFRGKPTLSTLGGTKWKHQKERVKESVRDLAAELLRVRAARESMPGVRYSGDTPWQREFEAEFPYEETEDQLAALAAIKQDMQSERPMDRLLCGDVGFGKTEVAIRAAFKAIEFGKQVAVLVPTTVLAEQHERTFRSRLADYPFKVESLSRFKTDAQIRACLDALRRGHVDIAIGTHRLLSKDVHFADLGLVIVDEEQRFGVEHKERLLSLRMTADVLTLSATPIPRTLHMSMLGLRDISSLATPPADRHAVVTEVIPWNPIRIERAIRRELAREGQVFFVNNRVHNIHQMADEVGALVPEARVIVGHGQMPPRELEAVMLKFMRREADILVSTTIIESGIDIPTANTMIIVDADRFGLADLHQLRGRVGRYKHRAYCYMLLPLTRTPTEKAKRRLKAIEQFSMLGAGFKIAMQDLEIRGAGNLLGPEQSGHIAAVGYDMYCRLLEQAVRELKDEPTVAPSRTVVDIGVQGVIPKAYIPSDQRRMEAYRRLATATSTRELDEVREAMLQAYGTPPQATESLLDMTEVRVRAATLGVQSITIRDRDVVFRCDAPEVIVGALEGIAGSVRPLPPKPNEKVHEVYFRPPDAYLQPQTLLRVLTKRLAPEDTASDVQSERTGSR